MSAGDAAAPPSKEGGRAARRGGLYAVGAVIIVVLAALVYVGPMGGTEGTPGSRARDYASSSYAKLVVEVDWLAGAGSDYRPSASVLSYLQTELSDRLTKPGGIVVQYGAAIALTKDSYSPADLREVERAHRELRTGGDTAAIWVLFANRYAASANVAGVAYSGSAVAVFAQTIDDASTFAVAAETIERVTLLHEAGHLLGLVNGGTPMVTPHEDAAHRGHSSNDASIMYWAVESDVVSTILGGRVDLNNPFDANDIADLRAVGGR